MDEKLREKFLRIYPNIPGNLKGEIIVVINEQPYNWETAYFEVKNKTKLAEKILNTLKETGLI